MGVRKIIVSVSFVERILRRGTHAVEPTNVPPDFTIRGMIYNGRDGEVEIVAESGDWGDNPERIEPKVFTPQFRTVLLDEAAKARIFSKPVETRTREGSR